MDIINSRWAYLPYPVLSSIFSHFQFDEVISFSKVCSSWFEASRDELLWKQLFKERFNYSQQHLSSKDASWYNAYKRLYYNTPLIETEKLQEHRNEVLHVSFSNDGNHFATCSKDGTVCLWNSEHPVSMKYSCDMKKFSWMYTQYSKFNKSDTLLLVSGVYFGSQHCNSGEIAVFNIEDFVLQCRIISKPYDIFGAWYCDDYLISGKLYLLARLISTSHLHLNKASQEIESEHIPITHNMFRFYNKNASTIRNIQVVNCLNTNETDGKYFVDLDDNICCYKCSNINCDNNLIKCSCDEEKDEEIKCDCKLLTEKYKYLIFTTGSDTYVPHQIGIKRIKPFKFPLKIDPGLSLKERLVLKKRRKEMTPPPEINWLNYEAVASNFDKIDHLIDLHGHIMGVSVSPDERYLYVMSKPWEENYLITDPLRPPLTSSKTNITVFDLTTFQEISNMKRIKDEEGSTKRNEDFFIYLDVGESLIACGSDDHFGYLWDRDYGVFIAKYPHNDVVNAVALNPNDEEMLVTVSDDFSIKIWRSRSQLNEYRLNNSCYSCAAQTHSTDLNFNKRKITIMK